MKVQCPNCNRNYKVDDHRVPDGGLKMRCPQCSTVFVVSKTGGDKNAGPPAVPKPPQKQVDKQAAPSKPATDKTQLMFSKDSLADDLSVDLPAPAGATEASKTAVDDPFGDIDLPAPVNTADSPAPSAAPPPPSPPAADDEDPFGEIDLPAPLGQDRVSIPVPSGLVDRPAASDKVDLPAPAGSRSKPPAIESDDAFSEIDLPAPSANVDLPIPTEMVDLPAPSENVDLPAPSDSRPDLPIAQSDDAFGEIDLPAPSNNVDFPIPVGTVDLPAPSENVDLPTRKETQVFGEKSPPVPPDPIKPPPTMSTPPSAPDDKPDTADSPHGFDEISLSSISLPPDKPPAIPSEMLDLPVGNEGGPGADPLTFPDSLAPPSFEGAPSLPPTDDAGRSSGDISFGEVDLSPSPSTPPEPGASAPGVAEGAEPPEVSFDAGGEFDEFPTRESLPGEDEADGKSLELAHDPFLEALDDRPMDGDAIGDEERRPAASFEGRRKWERQGRKTRFMLLVFLGVLILGGAGMTFTPLGPFGAYALVKLVPKFGQDAIITQTVKLVDTRIKTDTPFALNSAIKELERALSELPDNDDLQLLGVYLHTWYQIRFGTDKKHDLAAIELLGPTKFEESESPYGPLAEASRYALTRQTGKMIKALSGEIGETPNAKALMIAGYLNAGIIEKALTLAIQLDKEEKSARSGYFLAKSLFLNGAYNEATEKLTELIKKSPKHIGSKLLLAQTYLQTKPVNREEIIKLTNDVISSFSDISTSVQKAEAHALLGQLHLVERHVADALKEFEQAEKLDPNSISMLTGKGTVSLLNNDIPAAVSAFEKVLNADSKNITAQLGRVETIFREGRFADALAALTAILPKNQKNARAHYLMGKVQIALKNHDLAEQELSTAIEIDTEFLEAYVALSELYIAADKNSEAMRVLDKASKSIPESPLISQTLAGAHAMLGDYATAIAELFKAIELDPDSIRSYFVMAQMYRRMNSIDDARNSLSEVESRDPNYPGLALERGFLMELSGDKKAALDLYLKELALSKEDTDLKIRIGAASHLLGDNDTAEKYLKEVVAVIPKSAEANYYLGEICRITGRTAEAVGYLATATEQDPSNGLYHLRYGMSLQNTQDLKEAMKEYEIAKELDPNLAEVYVRIGSVLLQQGAAKDAFQFLDKGLSLDPTLHDAYWLMADSFEQQGELRSAAEHYRKAIRAAPKEAELYFRLGRVELKVHGTRTALSSLMKAVQFADDAGQTPTWLPEALYRLGIAQENLGRKTNARTTFKRYLDIAPKDDIDRSEVTARLERLGG